MPVISIGASASSISNADEIQQINEFEQMAKDEDEIMGSDENTEFGKTTCPYFSYTAANSINELDLNLVTQQKLVDTRIPSTSLHFLYSGSKFAGRQTSGRSSYHVMVELQHVDVSQSFLCGYLNIQGLTDDFPELTTFFEAEIIGPKHSFLTRKWDATAEIDTQHWSKFPGFSHLNSLYHDENFIYPYMNSDFIFMRWKEHFLVPDHKIRSISGASFAGFYYICYQISTKAITGFYYHQNSERFQHLELRHISETTFSSFQFR